DRSIRAASPGSSRSAARHPAPPLARGDGQPARRPLDRWRTALAGSLGTTGGAIASLRQESRESRPKDGPSELSRRLAERCPSASAGSLSDDQSNRFGDSSL